MASEIGRARVNPKAGSILVSRMNTVNLVGASAYVGQDWPHLVLPDRIWQLRVDGDRAEPRWLHQLLTAPDTRARISDLATGTSGSMKNISQDKFLSLEVPLPPLPEQRKIAAILSSVDDAIDKTQAVIDQLGVVKKAMMQELLTKGLPGRHTRFKQTEIGMVPEEWEVRSIESLLESCTYGVNCPLSADPLSGTPVLRMSNLQNDRLDLSDLKYADLAALPHDKTELRRGDLLFNRTNSADLVGKVALVDTDRTLSYASYLLRLRTLPSVASTSWLFHRMAAPDLQEELRSIATKGVSQSNINPTKMRAIIVAVPPPDEQAEIVRTLDCLGARAEAEADCLQQSRALKSALMSVLLTGEVRVTPDEDAA